MSEDFKKTIQEIERVLLNEIWSNKKGFSNEDDFDLACVCVEKIFDEVKEKLDVR